MLPLYFPSPTNTQSTVLETYFLPCLSSNLPHPWLMTFFYRENGNNQKSTFTISLQHICPLTQVCTHITVATLTVNVPNEGRIHFLSSTPEHCSRNSPSSSMFPSLLDLPYMPANSLNYVSPILKAKHAIKNPLHLTPPSAYYPTHNKTRTLCLQKSPSFSPLQLSLQSDFATISPKS